MNDLAKWFYTDPNPHLAAWIGRNGNAIHNSRAGHCIAVKSPAVIRRFVERHKLTVIDRREDGILYTAT